MQDKVTYEYAVIRLVPKVEREEFLNIGVILFSKRKNFLGMKYQIDDARIHAFSRNIDTNLIRKYMEAINSSSIIVFYLCSSVILTLFS